MKNVELIGMLDDKKRLETQVSSIIHGSIEVRDKECNKYIYVHYRDNGKLISRYVGEYSDELYNLILNNNIKVKELKKEIKVPFGVNIVSNPLATIHLAAAVEADMG